VLIKQLLQLQKGAANPRTQKVGKLSLKDCESIAVKKFSDMNCSSVQQAAKVIAGTARSMGVEVV
jgi:large subunit ribosomal protein L11